MNKKALLIMDMPENCLDCNFCFELDEGIEAYCSMTDDLDNSDLCRDLPNGYCESRPDWCPLKPLPDKKEVIEIPRIPSMLDFRRRGFQDGWNACIDEITGGDE